MAIFRFCILVALLVSPLGAISETCAPKDGVYRGVNVNASLGRDDFAHLSAIGVNAVRLSMADVSAFDASGDVSKIALAVIERYLALGKEFGVGVVLDIHTYPGSVKRYSGAPGDAVWSDPGVRRKVVGGVSFIAGRYKGDPYLVAIDIANELSPPQGKEGVVAFVGLLRDLSTAIRAAGYVGAVWVQPTIGIDKNGIPTAQYKNFDVLDGINDAGVLKSVHFYDPGDFTHQGIGRFRSGVRLPYPLSTVLGMDSYLSLALGRVRSDDDKGIVVGEFGVSNYANADDAEHYLERSIGYFERRGWSWFYHSYREAAVWSPEVVKDNDGRLVFSSDSQRMKLLKAYFRRNKPLVCN